MPEPTEVPLAARQQMAMARPWDHAEPESIHPGLTLATSDLPDQLIPSTNVTHARPLLLVHRREPSTAYYEDNQDWIDKAARP